MDAETETKDEVKIVPNRKDLRAAGLTLRHRYEGRHRRQAIKAIRKQARAAYGALG
jgi:hypothetical protein